MKIKLPTLADLRKNKTSFLIVIAGILALLSVYVFWLQPVTDQKDALEAQIGDRTKKYKEFQEKLSHAESIKVNLEKQETDLKTMQKRLFKGNDPYQLAASLGDLLSSKGSGPKLDIKTYQVLASKEYGLYQEVHLRFNFMATVDGLYYFLDRVRKSEAAILVQEINIQKIQRKTGADLVINVVLSALMEKGEKA